MRAERVVLDTNVLISAALIPSSMPRRVLDSIFTANGVLLFSDETFAELWTRLHRTKFDRYVSSQSRAVYLARVRAVAEWVGIVGATLGCRDPDDDKVLEVALMGAADCIVTGDQDLLKLASFRGIPILTPASVLEGHPTAT